MGTNRFVKPQVVRLPLSAGDYIDVKRRLNTGEQQELFAVMAPLVTPGEKVQLNSRMALTAKVMAYLLAWSFTDDGQPVPVTLGAVNGLDPDTFREIRDAIETHEDVVDQEIADQKKVPSSGNGSLAISTSVAP